MFLVLSKRVFQHQETNSSSRRAGEDTDQESALRRQQVLPIFWKHRGECEIPATEPAREDAEQRIEGSQGGHPTERETSSFITGERVHYIEMNCFIEKTENNISEEGAQYSEEYEKMLWMRDARIRTFMQLELEACQEEIGWMIRCHNYEALNRPQEEYPARPLPLPPNYIDKLHSRLIKVQQGVWPPTLKIILKTRYNLPAPTTSPRTVQSDDVMRGHRDGENSPQARPRASEEKEEVVVNGTPSTDKGGDFISQTKVETDHEPSKLADRQELVIFRQQKRTTAKSTDWGGRLPHSSKIRGEHECSYSSTSRRPRGGCDWQTSARDGIH